MSTKFQELYDKYVLMEKSLNHLSQRLDEANRRIEILETIAKNHDNAKFLCRACGRGIYRVRTELQQKVTPYPSNKRQCDKCGHIPDEI